MHCDADAVRAAVMIVCSIASIVYVNTLLLLQLYNNPQSNAHAAANHYELLTAFHSVRTCVCTHGSSSRIQYSLQCAMLTVVLSTDS